MPQSEKPSRPNTDPGAATRPDEIEMVCLECGTELFYKGVGRRPHYCSSACRHRGWERRRAAADGVVATRVVELPAPPRQTSFTRDNVAAWLVEKPARLAAVLAALPDGMDAEAALCRAVDRVRTTPPARPATLTQWEQHQDRVATSERHSDRRTMQALAAERDEMRGRWKAAEARTTTPAEPAPQASSRVSDTGPHERGVPPGYRVVEVSGKTFHVPEVWSRQQVRQWCRKNPDKAVG